ncbi:ATP-dependent nuclease [Lactobacillus apis]|uniref:ATP-dependent nuclease n=1 Tax=Lactobacillus apis TaxID=303541 RepID=UPI0016503539|nr:AAA family ATPase [Lactobacillus apis]MBC6361612.1 hypothetical protein [Lactobacillus apis]
MEKGKDAIKLTKKIKEKYELTLIYLSEELERSLLADIAIKKEQYQKIEMDLTEVIENLENSLSRIDNRDISKQFQRVLCSYTELAKSSLSHTIALNEKLVGNAPTLPIVVLPSYNNIDNLIDNLKDLISNAYRVIFMSNMATINSNIIIVGKNGSGKSTLVNSLSSSALDNMTVIPAQKVLYYAPETLNRVENVAVDTFRLKNLGHTNKKIKIDGNSSELISPFTEMVMALINNDVNVHYFNEIEGTSEFDRVKEIWKEIIPEITFKITDPAKKDIFAYKNKNNEEYSLNGLSDGEKCILFYIGNVILAEKDSYIVIDEPETFLNPASYNRLWDILIKERSDCQFIFTSHNPDFITARDNTTLVWCKNFSLENKGLTYNSELKILADKDKLSSELPTELISELVGSRKRILFCEGTNEKYDYKIYSKLYKEYTVKPVGGHDKVIQYTKTFNELPQWIENSAIGIIDNDGMSNSEKESLKKDNVFCLPYNEIEMLLLDEEVIFQVLEDVKYPEDIQTINKKIKEFKSKLVSTIEVRKNKIIYDIVKNRVDYKIRTEFIDSKRYKTVEDIKKYLDEFSKQMGIDNISEEVHTEVAEAIKNKEYSDLLRICTLKDEVTKGITDKIFGRDYVKCALARINQNDKIKEYLRNQISLPK